MTSLRKSRTDRRRPIRVCSVDVEAYYGRIYLVGTKEYEVDGDWYRAKRYRPFMSLSWLQHYLYRFPGLLIGHNWLRHDLKVLGEHFDVTPLIGKSVDTMLVLMNRNRGDFNDLGLDGLGHHNFGGGKIHKGVFEKVHEIWENDRPRALRHNHRDCHLAFRLWHKLVREREVVLYSPIQLSHWQKGERIMTIDRHDVRNLMRPCFATRAWKRWVEDEQELLPVREDSWSHRPL